MDRITSKRFTALFLIVFLVVAVFLFRLLKLQQEEGNFGALNRGTNSAYQVPVPAARGDILDRNGKVMVSSRASYNLTIANLAFFSGKGANVQIQELLELCDSLSQGTIDTLPITMDKPYAYLENPTYTQKSHLSTYLDWKNWDAEMSAKNLLQRMKELYRIPEEWDDDLARRVIGVRYELDLRYCAGLSNYILCADVSTDVLAAVLEKGIAGVSAEATTIRTYETTAAAHILGFIGPIFAEEWDSYKSQGYTMDALVGKDGVERAFEEYLRGTGGIQTTVVDEHGQVVETYYVKEPVAGQDVSLTIDLDMQIAAEETLEKVILDLRENGTGTKKEGKDAVGGAAVAIEIKTGEVLAAANYPTFDLATMNRDYNDLLADKENPLLNRAMTMPYQPGSIYKMVTSIAAIDEDGASPHREITDKGVYTYYADQGYTCNCHIWTSSRTTHGTIDLMEAISCSCNYYFYEVGREAGITALDKVAAGLGLGEKTGVEIYEERGTRANPETRKFLYAGTDSENWYGADTLQASIGQSDNAFTPLQMAAYCATLASGGQRMKTTLLHSRISWDGTELLYTHTPEVLASYPISHAAKQAVLDGMILAANEGTASTYLKNYPVLVAGKTGTAQHGSGGSDNASFICFAPAHDPQIAIAIYVEKGAQGGNLGQIARAMLDVYFRDKTALPSQGQESTPQ